MEQIRRIVANIERRHFFDAHPLHLFRLGGAVFAEAGKAFLVDGDEFKANDDAQPYLDAAQKEGQLDTQLIALEVKLAEAALRFPLHHPQVVSVIPGGANAKEVALNAKTMAAKLPKALWKDLKAEGLLRQDAPVPK